jgi:Mce-associated membrane protein
MTEPVTDSAPGSRTRLLAVALAVALVAALVAVVVLWRDRDDSDGGGSSSASLVDAEIAAETAAKDALERMTTYSFRTVDEDFGWVDDATTEKFQENFAEARKAALTYVEAVQATAGGTVVDSAATAADGDHVKVLLFADQEIRSTQKKGYRVEQSRVTMQMVRQDGDWLVDEVEVVNVLGSPSE